MGERGVMPAADRPAVEKDLRRSVGFLGVLGQSMAGVAPTTTPAINVALVFAVAGGGSWFAYLIATLAILLVALNIVPFARVFAGAGSLSEFAGQGLGLAGRLVAGWSLLLAYLAFSAATLAGCAGYASTVLGWLGLTMPMPAWVALFGAAAATLALRDVRVSTVLMLGLEALSMVMVVLLGVAILYRQGLAVDLSQVRLEGVGGGGFGGALLIAVLSFVGFEAAAALGGEARRPLRDIPRALVLTPALTGVFFVFSAYVIVLGFNRYGIDAAKSDAPLDALAEALHLPGLGALVAVGAAISLFTAAVATMVAASRIAFALAGEGALPAALARVSARRGAPQRALRIAVALVLATALGLASVATPLDIYDWLGTFGTFGCILAYALTAAAAPVFLHRAGRLRPRHLAASVAALAVLAYVLYGSLYPVPAAPLDLLPWLFAGLLAAGVAWSLLLRRGAARPR